MVQGNGGHALYGSGQYFGGLWLLKNHHQGHHYVHDNCLCVARRKYRYICAACYNITDIYTDIFDNEYLLFWRKSRYVGGRISLNNFDSNQNFCAKSFDLIQIK